MKHAPQHLEEHGPIWRSGQEETPAADWAFLTREWDADRLQAPFAHGLFRGVSKHHVEKYKDSFKLGGTTDTAFDKWGDLPEIEVCHAAITNDVIIEKLGDLGTDIDSGNLLVAGNPNSIATVQTGRYMNMNFMGTALGITDEITPLGEIGTQEEAEVARRKLLETAVSRGYVTQENAESGRVNPFSPYADNIPSSFFGNTLNVHEWAGSAVEYGAQRLDAQVGDHIEVLLLWIDPRDGRFWIHTDEGPQPRFSILADTGAAQPDLAYIVVADELPMRGVRVKVYKDASDHCQ